MPSLLRVASSSGAAASAAAFMFHLTSKHAHTEQNRPAHSLPAPADTAENRPAFSEGFVGMVGNTPLVNLIIFLFGLRFKILTVNPGSHKITFRCHWLQHFWQG